MGLEAVRIAASLLNVQGILTILCLPILTRTLDVVVNYLNCRAYIPIMMRSRRALSNVHNSELGSVMLIPCPFARSFGYQGVSLYEKKRAAYYENKCKELESIVEELDVSRRRQRLRAIEERWQEFNAMHHLMGPGPPPKRRRIMPGLQLSSGFAHGGHGLGQSSGS